MLTQQRAPRDSNSEGGSKPEEVIPCIYQGLELRESHHLIWGCPPRLAKQGRC